MGKAKELLKAGFGKESAGDIHGALADYAAAQKLNPDARIDTHMRELRNKIAATQATVTETAVNGQQPSAAKPPLTETAVNGQASPAAKPPVAENPLLAQKKADLLRLGNEAMAIANGGSLATMEQELPRLQKIQSQVEKLTAEIKQLEAAP